MCWFRRLFYQLATRMTLIYLLIVGSIPTGCDLLPRIVLNVTFCYLFCLYRRCYFVILSPSPLFWLSRLGIWLFLWFCSGWGLRFLYLLWEIWCRIIFKIVPRYDIQNLGFVLLLLTVLFFHIFLIRTRILLWKKERKYIWLEKKLFTNYTPKYEILKEKKLKINATSFISQLTPSLIIW